MYVSGHFSAFPQPISKFFWSIYIYIENAKRWWNQYVSICLCSGSTELRRKKVKKKIWQIIDFGQNIVPLNLFVCLFMCSGIRTSMSVSLFMSVFLSVFFSPCEASKISEWDEAEYNNPWLKTRTAMSKRCDYLVSVQCGVVYYFLWGLSIDKNHDFCPTKTTWGRQTDLS